MTREDDPPGLISLLVPPALVAMSAVLLALMSNDMLIALAVWMLVSFPVGVLFGHCVLSEE